MRDSRQLECVVGWDEAPTAPEVMLGMGVECAGESARNVLAFVEQAFNRRRVRASAG
jgi:hypothetical protein